MPGQKKILLVEDDDADVELIRESLQESPHIDLFRLADGQACLEYLRRQGNYTSAEKPDLVLLDLNMPKMNGSDVLKEIKSDQLLKKIPVVILTTSNTDADITKTYDLGANCFITKPIDFEELHKVMNATAEFWFKIVKLPDRTV